ncbi:MAG: DUF4349 domain-containing protein [Peptococcales bacterium]|jgi:hypothetical protein
MRNCSDYREKMSLYIDDCLDKNEKAAFRKHLETCSDCQEELESLQDVVSMFNSLSEEELIPPASFRRELRKRIEDEQKRVTKLSYFDKVIKFINKFSFKTWMPLAAAAVLLFVFIPVLTNGFGLSFLGGAKSSQEMVKSDSTPMEYRSLPQDGNLDMNMAKNKLLAGGSPGMVAPSAEAPEAAPDMLTMNVEEELKAEETAVERKIIKTGYLNLQVDSYKTATSHIKDMVGEMQGYIVSENSHVYNQEHKLLAGSMTLRIPQERFDEALERVEQMGNANNRNIDSQDVTEEYVDVESRLKAMRLKEERLLSILNKSGSLGDILAVENELARTRADLEALEGRLKYLNNRTDLSTINVEIRETLTPVSQIKTTGFQGVLVRTQEAFVKSINSIIIGFGNFVVNIGAYLPYIVLSLGLLVLLWIVFKKVKNRYIDK